MNKYVYTNSIKDFDFHSARIIFDVSSGFYFISMQHKQDYSVTYVKHVKVCF
jgi:hypothetical protein